MLIVGRGLQDVGEMHSGRVLKAFDLALCINVTEEHPSGHSGWAVLHLLPPRHLAEPEPSRSKRYLASCQLLHLWLRTDSPGPSGAES